MRSKFDDFVEVLEGVFTRRERIGLWLLSGVAFGASKAGDLMVEDGVPQTPALMFGAMYAIHVLLIVWVVYTMATTGVRVFLRLWPRSKR